MIQRMPPAPITEYGDELLNPDMKKVRELTIGVPEEYFIEGMETEVADAVQECNQGI